MRHSPEAADLLFFFFFFFFLAGSTSSRSAASPLRTSVSTPGCTGSGSVPFASMVADASGDWRGTGALWEEPRKAAESAESVTRNAKLP